MIPVLGDVSPITGLHPEAWYNRPQIDPGAVPLSKALEANGRPVMGLVRELNPDAVRAGSTRRTPIVCDHDIELPPSFGRESR